VSRFGLTNLYLKCGLVLILFGLACGIALFALMPPGNSTAFRLLMWGAQGGFFGGVVLYVIGRIVHAMRRPHRA